MALDVGAVTLNYSVSPRTEVVERYARELKEYDEVDCWRVASDGHVFLELMYDTMANHAMGYIRAKSLTSPEAHQVMRWVRGLPWRGETIMLHLGW